MQTARTSESDDERERARRAEERRARITAHNASGWADAERWDLEFWQKQSPQDRLSALVALRNDLVAVRGGTAALDWDD